MDGFMWVLLIAVLAVSCLRLMKTRQGIRHRDRSEEIHRKLAELRKKRDEE